MSDSRQYQKPRRAYGRGFASAGRLLQDRIARAGESRGFATSRLLTHWTEVVGADLARMCTPVKVGYARKGGLGATLTLRVVAAAGPIVQTQSDLIRKKVNACYGYNAIARIAFTQGGAHGGTPGFAEAQTGFAARPAGPPQPSPEVTGLTADVTDPDLRAALAGLGARIQTKQTKG